MMRSTYRVVVGVDGSEGGRRALRWAVHDAALHGGSVQAINAWRWDPLDQPPRSTLSSEQLRAEAEDVLAREIDALPHVAGVSVASQAVEGTAAEVLSGAAADADLLVLGSHGHSRVWHTVLGSVSEECVRRATCPVVVLPVPGPEYSPREHDVAVAHPTRT